MKTTETEIKLNDAKIQLELAMSPEKVLDINVVRSCINAFISNARSVTFSMQKESGSSEKFSKWYKEKQVEMKSNSLLSFFNEQRVISIHQKSVQPKQRSINVSKVDDDGQVLKGLAIVYEFDEFDKVIPGDNGNVFRHCLTHLDYFTDLVREWKEVMN